LRRRPQRNGKTARPGDALQALLYDFEAKFFDDGIGEDFFRDALGLRLSVFAGKAIEIENKEFALADVFDGAEAETGEGVLNRLTLRIENGALWHDPHVCFHGAIIAKRPASESRPYTGKFKQGSPVANASPVAFQRKEVIEGMEQIEKAQIAARFQPYENNQVQRLTGYR
jgi:hypothetical protein